MDRGGVGRLTDGEGGPWWSMYDELRLNAGVVVLEEAGDCCEGGVYGIAPTRVLAW